MKYWFFNFEGAFRKGVSEYRSKGLFSNAMLLSSDKKTAKKDLIKYLDKEGINLVKIEEFYEYKPSLVDISDKENFWWIDMYDEVYKTKGCVFTPWESFD